MQANDIRFRSAAKVLGILSWADHRGYRAERAAAACRQLSVTGLGLHSAHGIWGVCVCVSCVGKGGGALHGSQTKQQIVSWGVSKSCQVLYTKRHRYSIHNEVTRGLYCRLFEADASTSYCDLSLVHFLVFLMLQNYKVTFLRITITVCREILSTLISLNTLHFFHHRCTIVPSKDCI